MLAVCSSFRSLFLYSVCIIKISLNKANKGRVAPQQAPIIWASKHSSQLIFNQKKFKPHSFVPYTHTHTQILIIPEALNNLSSMDVLKINYFVLAQIYRMVIIQGTKEKTKTNQWNNLISSKETFKFILFFLWN